MPEITVAKNAGFCPGVKRAVEMLEDELSRGNAVYCLGELIHNAIFNATLKKRGVKFITAGDIPAVPEDGVIFIRTHGEEKEVYAALARSGRRYVDATCPYVKKIHTIASGASSDGSVCVIMGDEKHPEVRGIMSFAQGECQVFQDADAAIQFVKCAKTQGKDVFAVSQTTFSTAVWKLFSNNYKTLYTNDKISDTICSVTETRQEEALALSSGADMVVVVGSRGSSNTEKLYEIAAKNCKNTLFAESAADLVFAPGDLKKYGKIVIIAGASTPGVIIQEVQKTMTEKANEELSFEELLDQSFKTLNTGDRVTGTILAVTPAEIKVDLGTKHTGILPLDEISADGEADMEQFHVGDPIEAVCIKFSETEGTVILSKRRLDEAKNAGKISEAYETGEILHGTVKDVVKGGVIVYVGGIRVFIPASQCGRAGGDLESMKNEKVPLKIIDYNAAKRRVVGSIRTARKIERRQNLDQFYATLEIGKKITGTVRSVTSYGAFVNIGYADGMIHVSEMFWGRIRNPAELFKPGDEVDVYIKDFDREKERISLGYKTEEMNPWNIFNENYKVGDVVNVAIVSLMPFGAFAEIIPGVDGLIHCSQIGMRFVPNPSSVLSVGDKVDVKIIAIDNERTRVSLSMKELLGPDEASESEIAAICGATKEVPAEEPAAEEIAAEEVPVEEISGEEAVFEEAPEAEAEAEEIEETEEIEEIEEIEE